ncbi:MAG TPA: hypothetical protein K8V12_08795, partial [Psychrobacter pasteurii]|nr:hypothetical protein [Psychrobacter pasteurii]
MSQNFPISKLTLALLTLPLASLSHAAGLDRSGQDTTAFFQDGTYAEAVYTYVDADVTGVDNRGNKTGDIAEAYDFFRYGVKTDVNDRFSVGVLYDEPWGAAAKYRGENEFTGVAGDVGAGAIQQVAQQAIANTQAKIAKVEALQESKNPQGLDGLVYNTALGKLKNTVANYENLASAPSLDAYNQLVEATRQELQETEGLLNLVGNDLGKDAKSDAEELLA